LKITDTLRTLFGIRKVRQALPPGSQPIVGSNIVRDRLHIHLKYPITNEQWVWLSREGWRTLDMRTNKRKYTKIDESAVKALIRASADERGLVHQAILDMEARSAARKEARREARKVARRSGDNDARKQERRKTKPGEE
jgi:hypothetical protein